MVKLQTIRAMVIQRRQLQQLQQQQQLTLIDKQLSIKLLHLLQQHILHLFTAKQYVEEI